MEINYRTVSAILILLMVIVLNWIGMDTRSPYASLGLAALIASGYAIACLKLVPDIASLFKRKGMPV